MTARERELLLAVLKNYPLIDAAGHKLSRASGKETVAGQEWLVEAMTQQQADYKKRVDALLRGPGRFFRENKGVFLLTLTGEQLEWMLRILNDIRVGTWERLGRPELEEARKVKAGGGQARLWAALELSGYFESVLLEAFS